jgi:hypothetical protein
MKSWTLVPLCLVAACGGGAAEPDADRPAASAQAATRDGGPAGVRPAVSIGLLPSSDAGSTAATAGTLVLKGGCLCLQDAAGARAGLAFATPATDWDSGRGVLRVGDRSYKPGAYVRIGGGVFEGKLPNLPWLRAPPADCLRSLLWVVSSIE